MTYNVFGGTLNLAQSNPMYYHMFLLSCRSSSSSSIYLSKQTKHVITTIQHNEFYKARQPEGQMPIMLATYSTNK